VLVLLLQSLNKKKGVFNMAGNSKRAIVQLESSAGTGYRYTITKSKRNHPGRVEYRKYDPVVRKHVLFKETK
jgi:large subunit ribosomal protein L33